MMWKQFRNTKTDTEDESAVILMCGLKELFIAAKNNEIRLVLLIHLRGQNNFQCINSSMC